MVRERQDLEFRSVRWQFGQAVAGPSPIIMLKSDCGRARNDDSSKLIELWVILARHFKRGYDMQTAMPAHLATTLNALGSLESTREHEARRLNHQSQLTHRRLMKISRQR